MSAELDGDIQFVNTKNVKDELTQKLKELETEMRTLNKELSTLEDILKEMTSNFKGKK